MNILDCFWVFSRLTHRKWRVNKECLKEKINFVFYYLRLHARNFTPDGPIFLNFFLLKRRRFQLPPQQFSFICKAYYFFYSLLFLGISQHALKLQGCWKEALQNVTYDPKFKKLRCTFCFWSMYEQPGIFLFQFFYFPLSLIVS